MWIRFHQVNYFFTCNSGTLDNIKYQNLGLLQLSKFHDTKGNDIYMYANRHSNPNSIGGIFPRSVPVNIQSEPWIFFQGEKCTDEYFYFMTLLFVYPKQRPIKLLNSANISVAVDLAPSHVSVSRGAYSQKRVLPDLSVSF